MGKPRFLYPLPASICKLHPNLFEVLGKDTSQSLICNIIDTTIMTLWQYRVMGGSAL